MTWQLQVGPFKTVCPILRSFLEIGILRQTVYHVPGAPGTRPKAFTSVFADHMPGIVF